MNSYYYTDETRNEEYEVLEGDGFKCLVCGNSEKEGVKLNIGFIKNKANVNQKSNLNKVTLCENHKNTKDIHSLKNLFLDLRQIAIRENNTDFISFTNEILRIYENNCKINLI